MVAAARHAGKIVRRLSCARLLDFSSFLSSLSAWVAMDFANAALAAPSLPKMRHLIIDVSSEGDTSGASSRRVNNSEGRPCWARASAAPAQCACDRGWLCSRREPTRFHCFVSGIVSERGHAVVRRRHGEGMMVRWCRTGRRTTNEEIEAGSERFPQVVSSPGIQLSLSTNNFVIHHGQPHTRTVKGCQCVLRSLQRNVLQTDDEVPSRTDERQQCPRRNITRQRHSPQLALLQHRCSRLDELCLGLCIHLPVHLEQACQPLLQGLNVRAH